MHYRLWVALVFVGMLCLSGCATTQGAEVSRTEMESTTDTSDSGAAAAQPLADAALKVQYLKGQLITTSPDGATPYGPPVSVLAKRIIDAKKGTIVEETWHGPEARSTTLVRRPETLIFDASDAEKSFTGTLTFQSEDWVRAEVTYDIAMSDNSGKISGKGVWSGDTYTTTKVFSDPSGAARAKMTETLQVVSETDFAAALPK